MKDDNQRQAMIIEFNALANNRTWSLVPSSPNQNIVGCKWVFRIKKKPDGPIAKCKVRLIAEGFHQRPDIGFTITFSSVIKPTTIMIVLFIALPMVGPRSS